MVASLNDERFHDKVTLQKSLHSFNLYVGVASDFSESNCIQIVSSYRNYIFC